MTAFIIDLLEKVKSLFGRNGSIPDAVQLDVHRTNDVEYYPCLPVVRSRGDYCLDDTTLNICTKRSTRQPSLLPPNIPFTVFRMRFSRGKLDLMCMCLLWPLIGCRRALKKISFYYLGSACRSRNNFKYNTSRSITSIKSRVCSLS